MALDWRFWRNQHKTKLFKYKGEDKSLWKLPMQEQIRLFRIDEQKALATEAFYVAEAQAGNTNWKIEGAQTASYKFTYEPSGTVDAGLAGRGSESLAGQYFTLYTPFGHGTDIIGSQDFPGKDKVVCWFSASGMSTEPSVTGATGYVPMAVHTGSSVAVEDGKGGQYTSSWCSESILSMNNDSNFSTFWTASHIYDATTSGSAILINAKNLGIANPPEFNATNVTDGCSGSVPLAVGTITQNGSASLATNHIGSHRYVYGGTAQTPNGKNFTNRDFLKRGKVI